MIILLCYFGYFPSFCAAVSTKKTKFIEFIHYSNPTYSTHKNKTIVYKNNNINIQDIFLKTSNIITSVSKASNLKKTQIAYTSNN